MKLRNKKTGEIVELCGINLINGRAFVRFDDEKGTFKFEAHSLAELNAEWEDYEEPKGYWFIRDHTLSVGYSPLDNNETARFRKEIIGNYFETKEEAEKAVEKLKAWKRLRDKGLKSFSSDICGDDFVVNFKLTNHVDYSQSIDDFDCIFDFGGEE